MSRPQISNPRCKIFPLLVLLCALLAAAQRTRAAENPGTRPPFELLDGDRVVFLGDTLIEREQTYGQVETRLQTRFPNRNITFRNLGWSADTVLGTSRAGFDPPAAGFDRLKEELSLVKPTCVFFGYGMAASFAGEPGVTPFEADLNTLAETIRGIAKENPVRFVFLSPIPHENLGPPLPDPAEHNRQLARYAAAVERVARRWNSPYIALIETLPQQRPTGGSTLTDNGIHLNAYGYARLADAIEAGLGWEPQQSIEAMRGPRLEQAEALRQAVIRKNELFFHRWRPENQTYLFGFRKYEQGQNAREIPMFDPLVEGEEKKIAALKKQLAQTPEQGPASPGASVKPFAAESGAPRPAMKSSPQPLPEFEIAPGFEVSLYAEDPQLAKPIQMNFDPAGRLWVVSSSVYPQIGPGQKAEDKVLILEDTDNDGKVDRSTVFAEGLLIPTGIEPGDGGVYVGQSTELLYFRDRDGDGKADERRVVLSGFGTEDTHHILHTLHWGCDGQLYFNQSIYIHSHIETPHGVVRLNSGGLFHLRPPTMELGVFLRGFCNPWGHAIDRFGQSFETDGAGSQGISYGVPGAMYFTYAGMRRELQSISPGNYPKFCGLEIVYSQQFPDDWQGNEITCDFRAHRVVRFEVNEQGSGYITRQMPDLLRSTNVTFRPIDVKLGPDGALYIADWSNPIIQHGEVDFRDPRRDHEHGRIWRVTAKGRPLLPKPRLVDATDEALLNELLSPNGYNRQRARRVLTERGQKIVPALTAWTDRQQTESALLEALWIYQSIDQVRADLLDKLLAATDGHIRAAATRVLRFWHGRVDHAFDLLARMASDEHPRVRLEALRSLSQIPTAESAAVVLNSLDRPLDPFLDYAVWLTINDLAGPWIDSVQSGAWKIEGQQNKFEYAVKVIEPDLAAPLIGKWFEEKSIPRDGSGGMIEIVGLAGSSNVLDRLFQQVLQNQFDPPAAARALKALGDAARLRKVRPSSQVESIARLISHPDLAVRREAVRLEGQWKVAGAVSQLLDLVKRPEIDASLRQAGFESLREIGGADVLTGLQAVIARHSPGPIQRGAVLTWAALDPDQGAPAALELIRQSRSDEEAVDLWRGLLNIKGAAPAIARALPASGFPERPARMGLRVAREGGRQEPELVMALARAAQLDEESQTLTAAELRRLVSTVTEQGDAATGEAVYRRKDLACVTCHAIGGAGGKVGPDLSSIGASAPLDYLVESVISPNKKIKEGFESVAIQTKDGQEFSGIILRESPQELVIRDASNQEKAVVKSNIQERHSTGSLMPSGLINNLNAQERANLFRFLSELGKPGPFDASKGNVARSWMVSGERKRPVRIEGTNVLYTLVDGRLPREQLQASLPNAAASWLGTRFQAPRAGRFKMMVYPADSSLWIDEKPVDVRKAAEVELSQGAHTVILKLNGKQLPDYVRLQSDDGVYLPN